MKVNSEPKSILVINHYTSTNAGDAAMFLSFTENIRKKWPNVEISLLSNTPVPDRIAYQESKVNIFPSFWEEAKTVHSKGLKYLFYVRTLFFVFFFALLTRLECSFKLHSNPISNLREKRLVDIYSKADMIVHVGGEISGDALTSLLSFFPIIVGFIVRKPLILFAQTVLPVRGSFYRVAAKFVFKRVNLITVRDYESAHLLKTMGISSNVYSTADIVFGLKNVLTLKDRTEINRSPKIGISVRQWSYPFSSDPYLSHINYVRGISMIINYCINSFNASVYLFPMEISKPESGSNSRDDLHVINEILAKVNDKKNVSIWKDYSPHATADILHSIEQMDFFVSTRLHSTIFCVIANIPFVAISYAPKISNLMTMLELDNWCLSIDNLSHQILISKINDGLRFAIPYSNLLASKSRALEKRALANFSLLFSYWENRLSS